jgi:predicted pyridoxine 5'-phosphate oxidase superfamily flavin-nucleotide-binding protein
MNKTLANLKANPKIAIYVWGLEVKGSYQIKGTTSVKTSGKGVQRDESETQCKEPGASRTIFSCC